MNTTKSKMSMQDWASVAHLLTPAQLKAVAVLRENGAVFAGYDCDRQGRRFNTSASTLRALERLGLVKLQLSPDGGMMAVENDGTK